VPGPEGIRLVLLGRGTGHLGLQAKKAQYGVIAGFYVSEDLAKEMR
jgi:hypothetical protein